MSKDFYTESIDFYFSTKGMSTFDIAKNNHPFLKRIPKHLYKYRKSGEEGRIDFYVGRRNIYTASLNNLNDIFEGITPATKERIEKLSNKEICNYYKNSIISILQKHFGPLNEELANRIFETVVSEDFDEDSIYLKVKKLVDKEKQKELKTVISALCYLFLKLDKDMNKDEEFAEGMKMLMNINETIGAFCMCDSCANENLWALYSDGFKGYCIEYDLSNPCQSRGSIKFISALYPVNYVAEKDDDWFKPLYESTVAAINSDGKANRIKSGLIFQHRMIKTICSKKKDMWSTEHERRFIGEANHKRLGPLVSSIIVGHNIKKDDFDIIKMYANKNGFPIKITCINYQNHRVDIRDITENDIAEIESRI